MKYFFIPLVFLAAGFSGRVSAETFMPPAQDQWIELGLEALKQEAPGIRFGAAYVMNMGIPSLVSKIGLDGGLYSFKGMSGLAPEYGFFLVSTVYATPSYAALIKTGLYTLAFMESESTDTSMSSVAIEPSLQWNRKGVFWEIGFGARYWKGDSDRIEVGSVTIEKEWLFYPKIGVSGHF
ncbi:MAG TPA: hypothetical protein VFO10_24455 [Oligoflexus sp.]|uniref:hypothetical protein n=1 Tax=Oligoflexus sp. TaxID=1971216 RepID=UPI002D80073E|nr:hypothetical protein [Oligoflexus sp.]HET9240439.1 hypothetical protein [Oligoflexus sp.]